MKTTRARYQQGSIRKVPRARGFAWEVRFSTGQVAGEKTYKSLYFSGEEYPTEAALRKALAPKVILANSENDRSKVDAAFGDVVVIYRSDHLPNLEHSTQQTNSYFLDNYIEPKFSTVKIANVSALSVKRWLDGLKLAPSTRAGIRSVISVCFDLAALHKFVPETDHNPMTLVKIKGVSKRKKRKRQITVEEFHRLIKALPEPLNTMVLVDGCLGLRISELVALKWEDINKTVRQIMIQRKFTHGKLGQTKSDASDANLPLADALITILEDWKPKTDHSEWVFPSRRTGGVRSASMLLQKGIQPVAREIGLGHITWHMLRHACRSWLDSGKTPAGVQKDLLRVADISTAMDIYGSASAADMRKSHNKLVKKLVPPGLLNAAM